MRWLTFGLVAACGLLIAACSPQESAVPTPNLQAPVQTQVHATISALDLAPPVPTMTPKSIGSVPTVAPTAPPTATPRPPTAPPYPTATLVPQPTKPAELFLDISSVTTPVRRGATATLRARTLPNANCSITVYYKSGPSTAKGLEPKMADPSGNVAWSWTVGSNTTPGTWRIVVSARSSAGTISRETTFTVL